MTITQEDFELWRLNPVTEAFFTVLRGKIEECKASWMAASWAQGKVDERLLADLRARADISQSYVGIDFETLEAELERSRSG